MGTAEDESTAARESRQWCAARRPPRSAKTWERRREERSTAARESRLLRVAWGPQQSARTRWRRREKERVAAEGGHAEERVESGEGDAGITSMATPWADSCMRAAEAGSGRAHEIAWLAPAEDQGYESCDQDASDQDAGVHVGDRSETCGGRTGVVSGDVPSDALFRDLTPEAAPGEAAADAFLRDLARSRTVTGGAPGGSTAHSDEQARQFEALDETDAGPDAIKREPPVLALAADGLPRVTVELRGGLQGRPLAVEGVFRFQCGMTYGTTVPVDALVTLPFTCRDEDTGLSRPEAVRLVRRLQVGCEQRVNVQLRVEANDDNVGLFQPARAKFKQLLVAPTIAVVRDGHVTVPIVNVQGGKRDAVKKWINAIGDRAMQPLPGEAELDTAELEGKDKELILRLLRCYSRLLKRHEGCPPLVTTGRLDKAGMTLKASKCTFGARSIEYLGHHLEPDGVRPLQTLVTAVEQSPRPEDPVAVKRSVHLVGYYRRFVLHFGTTAASLTKVLRKDVEWRWSDEEEQAFVALKSALVTKPVLQYPDFGRPFILNTDASKVGLGAALMQERDGKMLPVAYASFLTEDTVVAAQRESRQCRELAARGFYKGTLIRAVDGVLKARTADGVGVGALCDRWATDLAEPLHVTPRGNVYAVAFAEYLSKYVVAVAVPNRMATTVAGFDDYRVRYLHTSEDKIVHVSLAEDERPGEARASADEGVVVALPIPALACPQVALHSTDAGGFFAEVARRKTRNRVSRYATEYLVERRSEVKVNAGARIWVSAVKYARLRQDERLEDDARRGSTSSAATPSALPPPLASCVAQLPLASLERLVLAPLELYEALALLPVRFLRRHVPLLGGALVLLLALHGAALRLALDLLRALFARVTFARDPPANFRAFWLAVRDRYAALAHRHVDWTAVLRVFGDAVGASTSDDDLWLALHGSVALCNDPALRVARSKHQLAPPSAATATAAAAATLALVERRHLTDGGRRIANHLVCGVLNPETSPGWRIGYICLGSMAGFVDLPLPRVDALVPGWGSGDRRDGGGDDDDDSSSHDASSGTVAVPETFDLEAMRWALEAILKSLGDVDGLLLDLRANQGGGSLLASLAVASYFTGPKPALAFSIDEKVPGGADAGRFSKPKKYFVPNASRSVRYRGPLVVLQSSLTRGTAELLCLALRSRPHTCSVGSRTAGSLSATHKLRLPNSWTVEIPHQRCFSADGELFEGVGIPPTKEVGPDALAGGHEADGCVKRAVEHIMNI
ncbi:hypothetical protein PybrP1_007202 [[Pythium] brassicae (nom. inval.)]|nr:hypothetical protein PybrP1_007202 [[Pythium] brassicae (nom. inval.)]